VTARASSRVPRRASRPSARSRRARPASPALRRALAAAPLRPPWRSSYSMGTSVPMFPPEG
jgi:hypothetical protein